MPSRLACVAILVYWAHATWGMVTRELIPELNVGGPLDLRAIASAGKDSALARWGVQVVDDPARPDERRTVGQATTRSVRRDGGWIDMTSQVWFDSGRLLQSTALTNKIDERIEFTSTYEVDPSGNLRQFHAGVRASSDPDELLRIDGRLNNGTMEITSRGPVPFLNRKLSFAYQERGVVGSQLGPVDRLPGLQVGQRWDERIANPLTGQVEKVRAEVRRKAVIHWDKSPVEVLEVVHTAKTLSARTWVRRDGVVLRQEVPLPLLRLVLERHPDSATENGNDPGAELR